MTVQKRVIEIIWLAVFFLCIITGAHQTYYQGISKSYEFFVFAIFAYGFYWIRKNRRKNYKEEQ
jgi:hypothetical protein